MPVSAFVDGKIIQGHQIASGNAADSPYPDGSIPLQIPYFKQLGLDLADFYPGTLNVNIAPAQFAILKPLYQFEKVQWIDGFPAETFSFTDCTLWFGGKAHQGYVYYPHAETKTQHFHSQSALEVLCRPVADIRYGHEVRLQYVPEQLAIVTP